MDRFQIIYDRAAARKGGTAALEALLPRVRTSRALARVGDDRVLAEMTRCVFQAGFVWRVVDQKWEGFESVFFGFDPEKIVLLSPEQLERFSRDRRIVRNLQKVGTVPQNARYILDLRAAHGSFTRFARAWPDSDLIGLFAHMRRNGARLGGMTGQRVLRNIGRDTFILTGDVVHCLQRAGVDIGDNPTSKRELHAVQAAFNDWQQQSGLPYAHLSRICACSVGRG
jgi:3-methyladenine DNA glycosylase Tag